jgi:tetratricopeptide (TPR) repeat protein
MGDMNKSIFHAKRAVDLDPLSASYQSWLAWLYYHNEDYDQAEFWARESLELSENIPWGNMVLGWTYLKNKQFAEAIETHEKLPNKTPRWKWFLCRTYVLAGEREKAISIFNEIEEYSEEHWVNPFYLGMIAGILGFTDKAFELINEAYDNNFFPMIYIDVFPSAEFIKNDPRYSSLLQKMNLPYK